MPGAQAGGASRELPAAPRWCPTLASCDRLKPIPHSPGFGKPEGEAQCSRGRGSVFPRLEARWPRWRCRHLHNTRVPEAAGAVLVPRGGEAFLRWKVRLPRGDTWRKRDSQGRKCGDHTAIPGEALLVGEKLLRGEGRCSSG